jgi:hypothetical protein
MGEQKVATKLPTVDSQFDVALFQLCMFFLISFAVSDCCVQACRERVL